MALAAFLKYAEGRLGGVATCSAAFLHNAKWRKIDVEEKKHTPLFFYHGIDD